VLVAQGAPLISISGLRVSHGPEPASRQIESPETLRIGEDVEDSYCLHATRTYRSATERPAAAISTRAAAPSHDPTGSALSFDSRVNERHCQPALFALPVTPEPKPMEIMRSDLPILGARISPDGRLIAYQSTETAESPKQGVFVRTLDLAAGKTGESAQQVQGDPSFGMGLGVTWRQDGRELYYLAPKHAVMAVDVTASPALQVGTPRALFSVPDATNDAQNLGLPWGNVARDGQRVVYSVAPKATGSRRSRRTVRASRLDGSIPSLRADDPISGS